MGFYRGTVQFKWGEINLLLMYIGIFFYVLDFVNHLYSFDILLACQVMGWCDVADKGVRNIVPSNFSQ